jgi:hypothetical protein
MPHRKPVENIEKEAVSELAKNVPCSGWKERIT